MPRCARCHRRIVPGARCPAHPDATPPAEGLEGAEPAVNPTPPELPGYRGWALLGAGGFARVFSAERLADGAAVAVKLALRPGDERFAREAAALGRVGAPHAPALLDAGVIGRTPYLVMERVPGPSLADWLAARPEPAPPAGAARILAALCAAVDAIHAAGLLHRDLKPENLILRGDAVTVLDFGLARELTDRSAPRPRPELTATGQRLGTVGYMAPEQCLAAADLDARTDLYAVGAIAFELFTGRPPFAGDPAELAQAHLARRPPRASTLGPVPPALDAVLLRALAKERGDRYSSARALADAVDAALAAAPPVTAAGAPAAAAAPARPAAARRKVALLAVRSRLPVPRIVEAIAQEHGEVARISASWCVAAFPHAASAAHGIRAALHAAARLARTADLCVGHAADLRVRYTERGIALYGAALDDVGAWTPAAEAPAARLLTAEAAALLEAETAPAGLAGFFTPPGHDTIVDATSASRGALHGRDALVAELLAEAAACHRDAIPTLSTLLGEVGHGKSRLVAAVAERLRARGVRVIDAASPAAEAGRGDALLRQLLGAALALPERPTAAEVELACGVRLGAPAVAAWRGVAHVLGALPPGDPHAGALLAAPGALRQTVASALGAALRAAAAAAPFAVIVNDAHRADPSSLDALEVATLAEHRAPLWVLVAAQPPLAELRRDWGDRAARTARRVLPVLDAAAATALLAELLHPAEYVPEAVVARLLEMTQGIPLHIVQVAQALRAEGGIRRLRGTQSFYVAADDLLHVLTTPLAERLAGRALAALSPSLLALARLCAVLGDPVGVDAIDAAQRLLGAEHADGALDPAVGAATLARQGLLRALGPGVYRFRHPMLREAIEALVPAESRRALHAAVWRHLASAPGADPLRLARHAAQAGARRDAASAYLAAADDAAARHDSVEADQRYSAALLQLGADDPAGRQCALAGRGKARCRLRRLGDAVDDLRAALAIAEARGDDAAAADLLLEEATVLDWAHDFAGSARAVERARPIADRLGDPGLALRCLHGEARAHARADRLAASIAAHAEAADRAAELGQHETRVLSLLLLAPSLAYAGRLDESERRFEELIELCERTGDLLHLGAAHGNRLILSTKRRTYDRAVADARRSTELARQVGNAHLEWAAQLNVGELLLWVGRAGEARGAAARALDLQRRFYERPHAMEALLLARIDAATGDHEAARRQLAWIRDTVPEGALSPPERVLLRSVELACRDGFAAAEWSELLADSRRDSVLDERFEVLHAALTAARAGRIEALRDAAAAELADPELPPLWRERIAGILGGGDVE